ncbi:hypothetical protein JL720_16906 [Aureococcus anophagefferens]|nr:hypothetical protein JL720_16906 [Aureococcus anophagefferens]
MGAAASTKGYTKDQLVALVSSAYASDTETLTISQVSQKLNDKERAAARPGRRSGRRGSGIGLEGRRARRAPVEDDRAVALRAIFDSLDEEGDHSISRREYITTMVARGATWEEASASFKAMDDMGSGRLTVAKFDHYIMKETVELVRTSFKEMDLADGDRERQLSKADVRRFLLQHGLTKDQAMACWTEIDANKNGKVNFREWRHWAEEKLTGLVVAAEQDKAAGAS